MSVARSRPGRPPITLGASGTRLARLRTADARGVLPLRLRPPGGRRSRSPCAVRVRRGGAGPIVAGDRGRQRGRGARPGWPARRGQARRHGRRGCRRGCRPPSWSPNVAGRGPRPAAGRRRRFGPRLLVRARRTSEWLGLLARPGRRAGPRTAPFGTRPSAAAARLVPVPSVDGVIVMADPWAALALGSPRRPPGRAPSGVGRTDPPTSGWTADVRGRHRRHPDRPVAEPAAALHDAGVCPALLAQGPGPATPATVSRQAPGATMVLRIEPIPSTHDSSTSPGRR